MKKLIFCFAALAFFVSCEPAVSSSNFVRITGQVIDIDTHDVIDGASVDLSPSGKSKVTGSDGYFDFPDLDEQQYTVTVSKTGYSTNRKTVKPVAGETENITITLSKKE
ncbi:carboxypeptidase regulatory-like domain-containing protein [bacterium]|nr:carboxypeptidase regulatory-like domain-containing protein [bacterium]